MLKVIAQHYIKEEHLEAVRPLFRELVEKSRAEELCIAYDLFVDQNDPGHFIFVEEWPDKAALEIHANTEHFKRLVSQIRAIARQEGSLLLMDRF